MITRRKLLAGGLITPIAAACQSVYGINLLTQSLISGAKEHLQPSHVFGFNKGQFVLDGKPFIMMAGELHPARIPVEYWEHRIQMVKALGLNTVSVYLFWNYFESNPGNFDFSTENRNLEKFLQLCQKHEMWVFLRPGPYVNAFWDLGEIPAYLLQYDDIKLRSNDARYMEAAERYIARLSSIIKPYCICNGGPILMVQIENEYGSFPGQHIKEDRGDYNVDPHHIESLRQLWVKYGITSIFSTNNGEYQVDKYRYAILSEQPIGLDPFELKSLTSFPAAYSDVPVFSSETYSGWDTLAGGTIDGAEENANSITTVIETYLKHGVSFSMYVAHGGSNFAAGGSDDAGPFRFRPIGASYDYLAPINEQGRLGKTFYGIRDVIHRMTKKDMPSIPPEPVRIEVPAPRIKGRPFASIWDDNLPMPVVTKSLPLYCEHKDVKRFEGCGIVYRTKIKSSGATKGNLVVNRIADIATVFVDGEYQGSIDHSAFDEETSIARSIDLTLPAKECVVDIFVYTFGHSSWRSMLDDRKGIIGQVTFNGRTLDAWDIHPIPMDSEYISTLKPLETAARHKKLGMFFEFTFEINELGETYIDVSQWTIGSLWMNGRRLGNYYCNTNNGKHIGPQLALNCPRIWLKQGVNKGIVFDIFATEPKEISLLKLDTVYDWKG